MSFADCENAGFYQYDAGGARTYKLTSDYVSQNIGGHWHTYQVLDNPTLYTSPYMVATPKGYTKHYYAESERVASRIGGGLDSVDMFIQNFEEFVDKPVVEISPLWTEEYHEEPFDEKRHHNLDHLYHAMECTGNVPSVVYECLVILHKYGDYPNHEYEPDCYWYHPDHLGSSSWITFSDGKAVQHLHYLPWGENFVDQRSTTWNAMYTFSAKEKDSETGYSYFGSRYYNSDLSIWLSVDPMASKYPSLSPYTYCANNPVRCVDPNGEENKYAFHYAQRNLLNKVGSVRDISTESWYGYNQGQHSTLTKQDPDKESCYGIIWHAYMNSGDKITSYLQTGFSTQNNSFLGRNSSKQWFKEGNNIPANQDGLSRSFETDIMKGEIGDIVFMGGHAAMLADLPEQIEEEGKICVKLRVYTTTSNSGFIEQNIVFEANNKNRTGGWTGFEGYGQLHQTQGKGDPNLE